MSQLFGGIEEQSECDLEIRETHKVNPTMTLASCPLLDREVEFKLSSDLKSS